MRGALLLLILVPVCAISGIRVVGAGLRGTVVFGFFFLAGLVRRFGVLLYQAK